MYSSYKKYWAVQLGYVHFSMHVLYSDKFKIEKNFQALSEVPVFLEVKLEL